MRIALVEVDHWHVGMYVQAVREAGHLLVAVSDRHDTPRARQIGVPVYGDTAEMLDRERPEFVFTFGRHAEQAAAIRRVIDRGVPLCAEKPTALNYPEAEALAQAAASRGLFAGVSFVMRLNAFFEQAAGLAAEAPITFLSLRYLTGGPQRYLDWGCPWAVDPRQSGGGPLWNVGTHLVDMACRLLTEPVCTVTARMTAAPDFPGIEQAAVVVLETAGGRSAVIETGYNAAVGTVENYLAVSRVGSLECLGQPPHLIWRRPGQEATSQPAVVPGYARFIRLTLERFQEGRPPLATLAEAAAVVRLIEAAYRSAREHRPVALS